MKNIKNFFALAAATMLLTSCNSDDDNAITNTTGTGNLKVEYDNSYAGNDLILGTQPNTTSNAEVLKISTVKYIVSNIVLIDENGVAFTYPKSQSYFIINEADENSLMLNLQNIPAANYTKIKFGIGVDQAQWELGADGQGDFLAHADAEEMLWSWSAGYKFLAFEGQFTSPSVTTETDFMVHTGKTGSDYNYTEVTLDLPQKALVRSAITPEIHVVADLSQIIDGGNKIKLTDHNMGGMGAMIMGGAALPLITQNLNAMFHVAHVHND
ncbi:MbnP family protein [Flavobacterium sp.]|uniref:MbnP family protein n=1 Tax=Flavobacterium sp. TaxID=239 RepID=UPI0039E4E12B